MKTLIHKYSKDPFCIVSGIIVTISMFFFFAILLHYNTDIILPYYAGTTIICAITSIVIWIDKYRNKSINTYFHTHVVLSVLYAITILCYWHFNIHSQDVFYIEILKLVLMGAALVTLYKCQEEDFRSYLFLYAQYIISCMLLTEYKILIA